MLITGTMKFMLYYPGNKPFICIVSRYTQGGTHTADAIRYARETAFTPQNGMRPNAAHIAIIVTDGEVLTTYIYQLRFLIFSPS